MQVTVYDLGILYASHHIKDKLSQNNLIQNCLSNLNGSGKLPNTLM